MLSSKQFLYNNQVQRVMMTLNNSLKVDGERNYNFIISDYIIILHSENKPLRHYNIIFIVLLCPKHLFIVYLGIKGSMIYLHTCFHMMYFQVKKVYGCFLDKTTFTIYCVSLKCLHYGHTILCP